jgi:alpha-mannosidase
LWGHSHLDVAWLWTYDEAMRKAVRTFANALALIDADPRFIFMQSQPQLYAFVREMDPVLFERVRAAVAAGRWDAGVAALWVEPDCNLPSGESLIRQMLAARRFCVDAFGVEPSIAWLPDTFGYARTLPTLLAHCGITRFGSGKLLWNDTNAFPHEQFRWRGPDGSEVLAASIASFDGGPNETRIATARARNEPLVIGYGDGGGGPTIEHLQEAETIGTWEAPNAWFDRLDARRDSLPIYNDEIYLENHRGVQTTHHDVKAANAALERALVRAEERVAWCKAVQGPRDLATRMRGQLDEAWEIVLRNQFHDVLPGTSIAAVYEDVRDEYARAEAIVETIDTSANAMLPRAARASREAACVAPTFDGDDAIFDNGIVRARVQRTGAIVELAAAGGRNVVAQANLLATYRDRPRKWEAWNIDRGYETSRRAAVPKTSSVVDGGLEIPFMLSKSPATMRIALREGEPFVRVELVVAWNESQRLLRCENWIALSADDVTYGAPHGVVRRRALGETPQERAKFEVPGQRFAIVEDASNGFAMFALDTYGWSARSLPSGGVQLGHSLLRSTRWPDPAADRGEQRLSWAYAPTRGAGIGAIEMAWERFAGDSSVRLFTSADESVRVVACKPADDGDGVIVRVRECDGAARSVRLRCGARIRTVEVVDGCERPISGGASIEEEQLISTIPAFGLRSFRVHF